MLNDNGKVKVDFETKSLKAKITAIQEAVVNGNSHYYFKIEGEDKVFIAPISLNSELPLLKVGDQVSIEFVDDDSASQTVSTLKIG